MRVRTMVLIGLVATSVVAVASIAVAHTTTTGSTVRITDVFVGPGGTDIEGDVRSRKDACERGRTVKVFHKVPGPDFFLGKDRTNRNGEWDVSTEFFPDVIKAKLLRKTLKDTRRHKHRCSRDTDVFE